jgi:glycosyltransferase involved in cell wall biosynthesis
MINKVIMVGSNSIHLQRYISEINRHIHKIIFITNSRIENTLPNNVEVHVLDFRFLNLKTNFVFAKILRLHPDAIIHIHQANSYAYHTYKAIKKSKIHFKTILTTWGSDILVLPKKSYLLRHVVKYNLLSSDIITADAMFIARQIKLLQPKVKEIETLLYGIQSIPVQLDLSQKDNIILSTRLHKPLYNIDKIIIAFSRFNIYLKQHRLPMYKLIIASSGPETESLKKLAQTLDEANNNIEFTGNLDFNQLSTYYKKAKFFVSIPDSDGTSSSLLEAMAFGCFPIVSNLPANLEWITYGENGFINYNNQSLYTDLIHSYKTDQNKYNLILSKNHKTVLENASFKKQMTKFIALYDKLIKLNRLK